MQEHDDKASDPKKYEYVNLMLESQGYSIDDFIEYIGTLKPNGGKLEAWSLSEFPTLVSQFRQLEMEKKMVRKQRPEMRDWKRAFVFAPEQVDITVDTKKPERLKIFETQIDVRVKDITKKDVGKVFKKIHTYYVLETQPQGWRVERRYKDMLKLRNCLGNFFPGFILPSLPTVIFEGENEEQVCSHYIELFFEHLIKIPELRGFEPVEKFLELSERQDFLKYLNALYKANRQTVIKELVHSGGAVCTDVVPELITFSKNAGTFARLDRESLDELYDLNRELAQQFETMTNRLRGASLLFRKLASNAMTIQKTKLQFVYKTIEQLLMEWSSLIESQWRQFRDDFSNYFKYYIFECEAMLELARNTSNAEEEYLERENELAIKKHALFKVKDFDTWQLSEADRQIFEEATLLHKKKLTFPKMLPKETAEVASLYQKYGYYINRMKEETTRVLDTRIDQMYEHFHGIAGNYAKGAKEMWKRFEEQLEDLENQPDHPEPPVKGKQAVPVQVAAPVSKRHEKEDLNIVVDVSQDEDHEDDLPQFSQEEVKKLMGDIIDEVIMRSPQAARNAVPKTVQEEPAAESRSGSSGEDDTVGLLGANSKIGADPATKEKKKSTEPRNNGGEYKEVKIAEGATGGSEERQPLMEGGQPTNAAS